MRFVVVFLSVLLCASSALAQTPNPQQTQKDTPEAAPKKTAPDAVEPPAQPAPTTRRDLSFFLLGNLDGRLADVDCRADQAVSDDALHYARQAAYFRQLTERAATPAQRPVALDLGDSTFPGALARYLLQSAEGARDFATTLDQIPYAAHALGDGDIGMERQQLLNFVAGAKAQRLPLEAANIACNAQGGAEAICDAVGTAPSGTPWQLVERGGLKIGVVTVVDPDLKKTTAKSRLAGFDVLTPSDVLPRLLERVRDKTGADLVVVMYHAVGPGARDEAVDLASKVSGIDLMFTNRLLGSADDAQKQANHGYVVAPKTGTHIVGADTGVTRAVTVDVSVERDADDKRWKVTRLDSKLRPTGKVAPDEATAAKLRDLGAQFCQAWGKAIHSGLALAHPFSRDDLEQFFLNVMRFTTDSEIALVNKQTFVDTDRFPIEGELTRADIYAFAPYNNRLYTAKVPGKELEKLAGKLGDTLVAAGLTKKGDKVLVNGRPLQGDRDYRVATHGFLASGGDDVLAQDKIKDKKRYIPKGSSEAPALSELVADFVRRASFSEEATLTDALDPAENFPDLQRNFLWTYVGSINASYNQVSVKNPDVAGEPAYDQSQLTVNPTTQINLEGNGQIKADSRNHVWDTKLLVQYAEAKVDGDSSFEQTKDLIRLRSTYQYAGFRADAGDKWYVPMPFGEVQIETEFDQPAERDWHKFETTGIAGAKFELFDPLTVKIGANARRDLPEPGGQTTVGLNLGYTLSRVDLIELLGKPIQFESELEYFFNDIGASNIQELRNTDRVYFALMDQLFFTTTFQAFLYRTEQVGQWGTNTELTVGLNYLWDATVQSF